MKLLALPCVLFALAAAPLVATLAPARLPGNAIAAAPERALCVVCQVKGGQTEPETVKAVRTHRGTVYGFCSEDCAHEFDADPAAFLPREFPYPAPAFSLSGLDGTEVSSDALRGNVVLLDFWATWCAPCRKAIPELKALHEKHAKRGFTVVGISVDEGKDAEAKVRKFVRSKKVRYPVAIDSDTLAVHERFRVKAVPATYLIDRDGSVVAQWLGAPAIVEQVEAKLAELLEGVD